ncbi:MAG: hypothetical protein FJ279_20630 [Planctomycetes bacterium]|nr:hypothetical protein [Planctomycetota bacterium]MBM4079408.1 hypothetical protein [Planctomycetota bacterium]MBM4085798.1 hypothetical protein [Planctomycetota bacterium]
MPLPAFNPIGDLPPGIHRATLQEAKVRFGRGSARRRLLVQRMERIYGIASSTGHLARFIVFGSFVTDKPEPNDVDLFFLMDDAFDVGRLTGESRLLFDHAAADTHFGASVFWVRRVAALGGEQAMVESWQIKRDGEERGVVEIVPRVP